MLGVVHNRPIERVIRVGLTREHRVREKRCELIAVRGHHSAGDHRCYSEVALGEGSGLVGADHRRRAKGLNAREATNQRIAASKLPRTEREIQRVDH